MEGAGQEFLRAAGARLEGWKQTADRAIAQLEDEQLYWRPDPESNSIAIIIRHLSGSMRSRWRDFLTSDGEKPDRDRDSEFELPADASRERLLAAWEEGWGIVRSELARVTPDDLVRTTYTRSQPEVVVDAIIRQLGHIASHVGQIVWIAKHVRGPGWQTLSIGRGMSQEYNRSLGHDA